MLFAHLFALATMGVGYGAGTIVIYGEVKNVQQADTPNSIIQLDPLCTLMGDLDPSIEDNIIAAVTFGGDVSRIIEPPPVGAKVICLLSREDHRLSKNAIRFRISNGIVPYFPKQSDGKSSPAMFIVTSFDDPKVTETIENVRKFRAKDREEAEKKAAAEKKP